MATNEPKNIQIDEMAQFDAVASEILQTFDPLITLLIERRDALLHQLSQLREDYTTKETTRKAAIQELDKTRKQLEEMSLKVNKNIPVHNQATMVYQQGLQDLEAPTKLPYPLFLFPTLQTIRSAISEFGEVKEWEVPDYSLKKVPILTTGKIGKDKNELNAIGLFLDEDNHRLYIADFGNSRVQVMSFEGEFLTSFGQDILKEPYGIVVNKEFIFITDREYDSLFKFCKNKLYLLKRTDNSDSEEEEELNFPRGICIDTNGDVFVANSIKHRVSIFSTLLQFKSNLGTKQLYYPHDVKLTQDCVVVLDLSPRCVHLFSRNGDYLSSCISQGDKPNCLLNYPRFFCFDLSGNIIISDTNNHCIKIFTQSGEFIHSIGRKGKKRGEFIDPYGIGISKLGIIFVLSDNSNYSLQCF
ncbi:Cell surface protein [Oopsacas minuta]|uniref:Cell surface protein n=1 Tax=Oopsacas minuta TaxID=111878 RepID=A0AAV7JHK0_9METZ|nr:Cell surface protein [Oopsacas minuta]